MSKQVKVEGDSNMFNRKEDLLRFIHIISHPALDRGVFEKSTRMVLAWRDGCNSLPQVDRGRNKFVVRATRPKQSSLTHAPCQKFAGASNRKGGIRSAFHLGDST